MIRNFIPYFIFIIVVVIIFAFAGFFPRSSDLSEDEESFQKQNTTENNVIKNDLIIEDSLMGTGPAAQNGDVLSMHYVGTLQDGTKFDSSRDRGQPFQFTLGIGQVIQGWELGVLGMKVGGKRRLTIPPELGYGVRGQGSIPPNSTLIFEIELLQIN